MRIAFLADIHANLEALQACLANARERSIDRYVFLGDVVGYGADPGACVDIVQEACCKGALAVFGNHDEAVAHSNFNLNEAASLAVAWTASVLSADQKAFLAGLPLTVTDQDRMYVHASARKPGHFPYVHGLAEAGESLMATSARLTVCGHVHAPALYNMSATAKVMGFIPNTDGPIPLTAMRRWLAVLGAVGQPRDGNPAAAYATLDTATNDLTFVRVPYDIDRAASKIRAAGLPDRLWKRLAEGR
jgi:diadenosine tetraphosphatase ApaH/serine/threonine PP2A family protein phosphatase